METHRQKIVKTLLKGWHCYGSLMAKNKYASSLPRTTAKLRETIDTSKRDIETNLIGILIFENKKYKWFEKLKGQIKYFKLVEIFED